MNIAIIGGGITGLTTALALARFGYESVVYEQAPELNEIGAGIWIQPNALKVLDWLGIKEKIQENGAELNKVEITDRDLKPFKKIKSGIVQDELGNKNVAIHRGRLQKVLYDAVQEKARVKLGYAYQGHTVHDDRIEIQFAGHRATADLLLGADGIHSRVRQTIFPGSSLRDSGQVCWRGISNFHLPTALQHAGKEAWGRQVRFGFSQVGPDEVYWFAVAKSSSPIVRADGDPKERLLAGFREFTPVVQDMIRHTDADKIHETGISDLARLPAWYKGPICLLGDAAHATTPNMGQGAGQGIEDAYYFSHIFSQIQDPDSAFPQFEQARRKKVDYVVNTSWRFGKMAHSPVGSTLLKLVMKLTPERVLTQQMRKLYAIERFS